MHDLDAWETATKEMEAIGYPVKDRKKRLFIFQGYYQRALKQ